MKNYIASSPIPLPRLPKKILFMLGVLLLPLFAFPYTVVRKDGRAFHGELIQETQEFIVVRDPIGIEVKFKTEQIDTDRTKDANKNEKSSTEAIDNKPPNSAPPDEKSDWAGERVSMDFKDIDVRDFFRFIAEISGMNMILDPSVKGSINIKLKDVPWDQAMDLVCRTYGWGYQVDGNVLKVKK